MSTYSRKNLAQLTDAVREITAINATLVVPNETIYNMLNEEVFKVVKIADETSRYWAASAGVPITVVDDGVTYRFPGWKWNNTTENPTTSSIDNLYMDSIADYAPWSVVGANVKNAGFYDNYLVYRVASRLLRSQADDTQRADEFDKQADEILTLIVRDEFVNHNAVLANGINPASTSYIIALMFKTMVLLKQPTSPDSNHLLALSEIIPSIVNERNELFSSYKWPFTSNVYSDYAPYSDIFAYGAAARLALRYGLSEAEQKSLLAEYETRKASLLREKLYNSSGSTYPNSLGGMRAQLRALLQDFSRDLPDALLNSWLNEAYLTICNEREWRWLEIENIQTLPANTNSFDLTFGTRIISMYEVELDENNQITESGQIYPVGHVYDVLNNASDYRYDLRGAVVGVTSTAPSFVTIAPTPKEDINIFYRFAYQPDPLLVDEDVAAMGQIFAPVVIYRAAQIGAAFHPQAKQLIPTYQLQEQRMYDAMLRFYQLDTSAESFTIGENALETRKYLPFFRVG